ncbi:MAG: DUF4124 domain-containing protein [Ghiorsea sp.]
MNIHLKHTFTLSTCLAASLFIISTNSIAEKIYRWTDDAGNTHYTNNQAMVPLKDDADVIKMKALPKPPEPELVFDGKALWEDNCLSCHHIKQESYEGKQGMSKLIVSIKDVSTSPEKSLRILQTAIKGNMDDNVKSLNKLNIDELNAIIKYIAEQVKSSTPSIEQTAEMK